MSETGILGLLNRIDAALKAEIEIVRDGRFQELRQVQIETITAMQALDAVNADIRMPGLDKVVVERAVERVNARAQQARGLIMAAMHGARDARARLEAMVRSEGEVGAYDRQGGRLMMRNPSSPYNKTL